MTAQMMMMTMTTIQVHPEINQAISPIPNFKMILIPQPVVLLLLDLALKLRSNDQECHP